MIRLVGKKLWCAGLIFFAASSLNASYGKDSNAQEKKQPLGNLVHRQIVSLEKKICGWKRVFLIMNNKVLNDIYACVVKIYNNDVRERLFEFESNGERESYLEDIFDDGASALAQQVAFKTDDLCIEKYKKPEVMELLNQDDKNELLFLAVEKGLLKFGQLLMRSGADLEQIYDGGKTLLHMAVQLDKRSMVGALIRAGAEVDKSDVEGKTALNYVQKDDEFMKDNIIGWAVQARKDAINNALDKPLEGIKNVIVMVVRYLY